MKSSWNAETIKKEILKYSSQSEFQRKHQSCYRAAKRLKLLDTLLPKQSKPRIWTEDRITDEVEKYKTLSALRENNPNAYYALRRQSNEYQELINDYIKAAAIN